METFIGFTGSFGSGCSHIIKKFLMPLGYNYISLSGMLKKAYEQDTGKEWSEVTRKEKQEFGNNIRKEKGNDILAKMAAEIIEATKEKKWVIDSVRNPGEINYFKNKYGRFFLVAIFASAETRWERVKAEYNNDLRVFNEDDLSDQDDDLEYGQRVSECFSIADISISNDINGMPKSQNEQLLKLKIEKYLALMEKREKFIPLDNEAIMAMAYANSMRSSCLKRAVGAVIADDYGNVFSSGYNEVPVTHTTCEEAYGTCYRSVLRDNFSNQLVPILSDEIVRDKVKELFQEKFKILDYCKSLHAEENAILNVARTGSSLALRGATLYTTTYPCNLCANKIVQVGIKKIVYLEPYPMEEAKRIMLNNKVIQEPFEGVTFNGYFKIGRF